MSAELLTAWRVVRPDFTSKNDYRWPYPVNWRAAVCRLLERP